MADVATLALSSDREKGMSLRLTDDRLFHVDFGTLQHDQIDEAQAKMETLAFELGPFGNLFRNIGNALQYAEDLTGLLARGVPVEQVECDLLGNIVALRITQGKQSWDVPTRHYKVDPNQARAFVDAVRRMQAAPHQP